MTTHAELVTVAERWLRRQGCGVVLVEHTGGHEQPDAIGWKGGFSRMVEVKVSRADFFADRRKASRAMHPDDRPAWHCWYLTPVGLVRTDEVPAAWGLLEYDGRKVWVRKKQPAEWQHVDTRSVTPLRDEVYRLSMELRRYQAQGIRYQTVSQLLARAEARPTSETPAQPREASR